MKFTSNGLEFYAGAATDGATDFGADTFSKIGNLRAVNGPSAEKGEIDKTDLDDTAYSYDADLPDNGEMALEGWFNAEAGSNQSILTGDAFSAARAVRNWEVRFPNVEQTSLQFKGFVKSFQFQNAQGGISAFTATVRLTTPVTVTTYT